MKKQTKTPTSTPTNTLTNNMAIKKNLINQNLIVLGFMLCLSIYFISKSLTIAAQAQEGGIPELLEPRILGNPNAVLTIYEFSSLTCPHCAAFHEDILPQIKESYIDTGKVNLIYMDFPLDGRAQAAALLARCVAEDVYYNFLDMLFSQQSLWVNSEQFMGTMKRYGNLAGLKDDEIQACFQNNDLYYAIMEAKELALARFDIRATPSFVIHDEIFSGNQSFERFQEVIEDALAILES